MPHSHRPEHRRGSGPKANRDAAPPTRNTPAPIGPQFATVPPHASARVGPPWRPPANPLVPSAPSPCRPACPVPRRPGGHVGVSGCVCSGPSSIGQPNMRGDGIFPGLTPDDKTDYHRRSLGTLLCHSSTAPHPLDLCRLALVVGGTLPGEGPRTWGRVAIYRRHPGKQTPEMPCRTASGSIGQRETPTPAPPILPSSMIVKCVSDSASTYARGTARTVDNARPTPSG